MSVVTPVPAITRHQIAQVKKHPSEIVTYDYSEKSRLADHFQTRNWPIKTGETASSKRVTLLATKESLQGGSQKVLDESSQDKVLTIKFKTPG